MSHLTAISISFSTPYATDAKKQTTAISVFVYDVTRTLVAKKERFAGDLTFPDDGSFSDVVYLDILQNINKADFIHGSFDVVIRPIGGDTWVMIPYLTIKYSDGSTITCDTYDNRIVSELATKTTLVF